jgi:hypothetical protein
MNLAKKQMGLYKAGSDGQDLDNFVKGSINITGGIGLMSCQEKVVQLRIELW